FFRLGDFYEMFYEDAKISSPILNVVLTSRDAGKTGRIPMCGIPYHAKDTYISKLIKAGLKVAICEQLEDPSQAKGIVRRDVIKIITSGTFIDENSYDSRYLVSIMPDKKITGIAFIDASTGQMHTNQYSDITKIIELISKLSVYECVFPISEEEKIRGLFKHALLRIKNISLSPYEDWCFNPDISRKSLSQHFQTNSLKGFGIDELNHAIAASGALLEYLKQMNRMPMRHICKISLYTDSDYVFISPAATYGLALEDLFKTMDQTLSPFGKRCLKNWVYHPLKTKDSIIERQQAVTLLKNNSQIQQELNRLLSNLPDIEKSISRVSSNDATAKDLLALRNCLCRIPDIQKTLMPLKEKNRFFEINDLPEIRQLLENAINPDLPLSNPEGKIIRPGYNKELDSLRGIQENAKELLKNLQANEIKRSGINSLKIGYNHVFGYYIEITKANLNSVPSDYIRKQTLANAERYITPELKDYEEKMLTAQDDILKIEKQLLEVLYRTILDHSVELHIFSSKLSALDALYSLSILALSTGWTCPQISEDREIIIKDGRHPVVESLLAEPFIPNDINLDCDENHLIIITGPNMSGKSTYIRQTAILVIMAQMGSYIPAASAKIGLVDKIFTRIGAHDEITKGQSTFMVEMNEASSILNNLSPRSLVILDEIGRGTSTYDGLSLAWSIAEYLQKHKARTLFATHFHELTALAKDYTGVKNYNVAVQEWNDEIVFLHKIIPGGTDDSYGIYVAKLAGIPQEVIQRAKQILSRLELSGKLHDKIRKTHQPESQLSLFTDKDYTVWQEIKKEISETDINSLTGLQALNKFQEWKIKIKK
ncbi:MAG: DNA mismatch repair protein MutS, partial [Candidatus Omnitrophota bacterium]